MKIIGRLLYVVLGILIIALGIATLALTPIVWILTGKDSDDITQFYTDLIKSCYPLME